MRGRDAVILFDADSGLLVAEAGVTVEQAMALTVPRGWMLPVIPGSGRVTLGGAVAADVHGKNHDAAGSIGRHVAWLVVLTGRDRSYQTLHPESDAEEFWATVGGLGLTGVITAVALLLHPVAGNATNRRLRGENLEEVMHLIETASSPHDHRATHTVAWLDGTAAAGRSGRGLVQVTSIPGLTPPAASPVTVSAQKRRGGDDPTPPAPLGRQRRWRSLPGPGVVSVPCIAAANRCRWLAPTRPSPIEVPVATALLPLRHGEFWPALFGRRGLVQYQFAVPSHAKHTVRQALELMRSRGMPPALATLKRLGSADDAPLTFAKPGWTLAMDFPARWSGLREALDDLDLLVTASHGRVYLAKDSRLSPAMLRDMYPRLDQWRETRDAMDPDGIFRSDLSVRLGLTGRDRARR